MLLSNSEGLDELWRRRLDTLITGVANGDNYYLQIANAAEHISAEYQGRFLIELVQNANDQAVRGELSGTRVTVVRTPELIAVGNCGEPFNEARIEAITSIFQSDKSAEECIGNKGVGFKAVFRVAESAEIYSSADGSHLGNGCATAFCMTRNPFADSMFAGKVRTLAEELLGEGSGRREKLERRFPGEDGCEVILREAQRTAWFTFPLPATEADLNRRAAELQLEHDDLATMQTLIILPLNQASQGDERIAKAVEEIRGPLEMSAERVQAASFLFLPGIGSIAIQDRVSGQTSVVTKEEIGPKRVLADGSEVIRLETRHTTGEGADEVPAPPQRWWLIEKHLGRNAEERTALREAIESLRLPEQNWSEVEQVPVAVALPEPRMDSGAGIALLGAHGRFCIGLPTQLPTGLPVWVHAHFHGKIDRTGIDFENTYNRLLFQTALELMGKLIEELKLEPKLATRRLATLALERENGSFADAVYAEDGLASGAVVLGESGEFCRATDLRLPRADDLAIFTQLTDGLPNVTAHGFLLPDKQILTHARAILDELQAPVVEDGAYLKKTETLPSLLELAAREHRHSEPEFWKGFFTWVLDRLGTTNFDALASQMILPTGSDDLTSAQERVFFAPASTRNRLDGGKETVLGLDEEGDELSSIAESVAPHLRFFDDTCLPVRAGGTRPRDYNALAQRLAPASGGGLVRRPRQEELINDALIPALEGARGDSERALALLYQALLWLDGMPQKSKQRVRMGDLLVPAAVGDGQWKWVKASDVYLSAGWADNDASTVELLTRAFGGRPACQLVTWEQFRPAAEKFKEVERAWWSARLQEIGVANSPRILRKFLRACVAYVGEWHRLPRGDVLCPVPCPETIWQSYLTEICKRKVHTQKPQEYFLHEVTWIDGLENADIRRREFTK